MTEKLEVRIHQALDNFNIELPSWGFANTGTRFGKFIQLAAAVTVADHLTAVFAAQAAQAAEASLTSSEADYERYHDVPARYFKQIDDRLGEYRGVDAAG